MKKTRAFTLIELLTVIAITAVLMTLIVLPLFQSFQILRQGQAFADAQDKGRLLVDRIAREVGNAISVRGGAGTVSTTLNGTATTLPTTTLVIQVPKKGGGTIETTLPESKLDLIPPATGDPGRVGDGGAFVDPNTGKGDPTLTRPKGDINLSPRPGATIVRWWIGLRDPRLPYKEPYTGLLMAREGAQDNLYVLWRAEVQPYLKSGQVNTDYFQADPADPTKIVDIDDPRFFMRDGSDAGKNARVDHWASIRDANGRLLTASAIQTEVSRYDMIRAVTTGAAATPVVSYDANGAPIVLPLVQFRPTRVTSAPAEGVVAARPGGAVDGADNIGPDTYFTDRGLWSNAIGRYFPAGYTPLVGSMEVAVANGSNGIAIYHGGSDANSAGFESVNVDNAVLFDLQSYETALSSGQPYAFTTGALTANAASNWTASDPLRAVFMPFRLLTATGKIVTSFPIEQVGTTALMGTPRPNLPTVAVGSDAPPTANTGFNAPLSPLTAGYDPNLAYNRIFNGDPLATGVAQNPLLQGIAQRFIDLRFVPNEDGTLSPLCPVPTTGAITGFNTTVQPSFDSAGIPVSDSGGRMNRVRIVPNSEAVYGPDQTSTGTYRTQVRYTRVSRNPGPNQYRLVYADLLEPTNASGKVDYSVLGLGLNTAGFDSTVYDKTSIISTVVQPQYKAGYLQLCSDPNVPIPINGDGTPSQIKVSYRFQFNGPGDTFAVDFDTREVMQVLLTIKNYPQSSAPNPQVVTLKSTATLRNALR